ncbi:MAG: hypothetical protein KAJ51_03290 [Thermoplasmata archaeon]|nr:hypothetical protein [Thermoplasmata archaeon]
MQKIDRTCSTEEQCQQIKKIIIRKKKSMPEKEIEFYEILEIVTDIFIDFETRLAKIEKTLFQ